MAQDTITELDADGAIAVAPGVTKITKIGDGSHTLASPEDSVTSIELDIISTSNDPQTVAGSFINGVNTYNSMQFSKGGNVRLRSDADAWYVASANRGVTFLGVAQREDS